MNNKDIIFQAIVERAWANGRLTELAEAALEDELRLDLLDGKFVKKYNLGE